MWHVMKVWHRLIIYNNITLKQRAYYRVRNCEVKFPVKVCRPTIIMFSAKHNIYITVLNHIKRREINYRDSTSSEKFAFWPNKSAVPTFAQHISTFNITFSVRASKWSPAKCKYTHLRQLCSNLQNSITLACAKRNLHNSLMFI